jgi:hypothetical protein
MRSLMNSGSTSEAHLLEGENHPMTDNNSLDSPLAKSHWQRVRDEIDLRGRWRAVCWQLARRSLGCHASLLNGANR